MSIPTPQAPGELIAPPENTTEITTEIPVITETTPPPQPTAAGAQPDAEPEFEPYPPLYIRLRDRTVTAAEKLPSPWSVRQPTLAELVLYSKEGDWSTRRDGARRSVHLLWTWLVTLPVAALCDGIKWSAQRPGRLLTTVAVVLLSLSALNELNDAAVADVLTIPGLWPF